ncbi:unnamed protein product [Sphagnum jensenii]|uniref:Uncharacterized protein n=1 Tax=Sphagnum jensenii TaxID=128206 RepID=A0ABP1AGZ0_9BRYO
MRNPPFLSSMRWAYSVSNRFIPRLINCLRFSVSQCSRLPQASPSLQQQQLTSELCIRFGPSDLQLRFRVVAKLKGASVALGIETNLA